MAVNLRNFQTSVKQHLGSYKKDKLGNLQCGKWRDNFYAHILPQKEEKLNIIDKYRNDFYSSEYSKINFHKYFHHLNSSQAMCINFFYPLIKEKSLESVLNCMKINGEINYTSDDICFEKESELDKYEGRSTNFDFYIKLKSGVQLYFEIKYTENGFGKA